MKNSERTHRRPEDAMKLAAGKWPSILMSMGVDQEYLTRKNCPCPMCGGKDRFRFINQNGDGWWICNQCGSGDGMDLLMQFKGFNFNEAANEVRSIAGGCHYERPNFITKQERRKRMTSNVELWSSGERPNALLEKYLEYRGLLPAEYMDADLRLAPRVPYYEDSKLVDQRPAMLARIRNRDGKLALIHRTYLTETESGFETIKKMTPSARDWKGGSAMLFNIKHETRLIVAEGIETALSCRAHVYRKHGLLVPCWAAISAQSLENMAIPEHIKVVMIAADNDESFTGQKAAFALANRLVVHDKRNVKVVIPDTMGMDFNDLLRRDYG